MDVLATLGRKARAILPADGLVREIARTFRWRDTAVLTMGTVGSQIISIATLPLLSRLYGPASFGIFAIVQSFAMILLLVSTLNIGPMIPTIPQTTLAARFTAALLGASIMVGATATVLVTVSNIMLSSLFAANSYRFAYWTVALGLTTSAFTLLRSYHVKLCSTGTISWAQIARSIMAFVVAAALSMFTKSISGEAQALIGAFAVGDLTAIVWFIVALPAKRRWQLYPLRPSRMVNELKRRRQIVLAALWSHSLLSLLGQVPLWFITVVYGAQPAGWFALANRVVAVPTAFIGVTVTGIFSSRLANEYYRGRDIGRAVKLVTLTLAAVGAVGYGALSLGAWLGTSIIFGTHWAAASNTLVILSLTGFAWFMTSAINLIPLMLSAGRFLTIWSTSRAIAIFLTFFLAWQMRFRYDTLVLIYACVECMSIIPYLWFVITATSQPRRGI